MAARASTWLRRLLDAGAVLAIGATLACYLARWSWLAELLCHFRVIYLWPLATYALVAAAFRRWIWAALAGAAAGVNLALVAPLYFFDGPIPSGVEPVTVLCSNVLSANRQYDRVLDLVREVRPDFVLFLEVNAAWAERLAALDAQYPYSRVEARESNFGMAFYSRLPIVRADVYEIGSIGVPAIVATLDRGVRRLSVVCAHPLPPGSGALAAARNEQLRALADFSLAAGNPVVLLGDLNCTSWSPYFDDLVETAKLCDSRDGFGVQPTWPADLPLRIPIDHCLVSPSIGVINRRVGPPVGSDHLPIIVELSLGDGAE